MATEIIVALIGLLGVLATALFGYVSSRRKDWEIDQARQELKFQRTALGFSEFLSEWDSIASEVERIMRSTPVDRFMILRAWNGHLEPEWTTAVYQVRQGDQEPIPYIHFELDSDYQNRLREIVGGRELYFETDSAADASIHRIYRAEGVTASYWAHLDSFRLPGSESRAVVYCSFATHEDKKLSEADIVQCQRLVSRLKGIVHSFSERQK